MTSSDTLPLLDGTLSVTAALVNESRARRVDLSRDEYARAWIPRALWQPVAELWDRFSDQVYRFDDIALSVRTRFFSRLVEEAVRNQRSVVVAPCGLTSYPFLIDGHARFLEIDLPAVVRYKTTREGLLRKRGQLPQREVHRIELDILANEQLIDSIRTFRGDSPILFILEGLSYYLTSDQWDRLVRALLNSMRPGDQFASDYWSKTNRSLPAYGRYKTFCAKYASFTAEDFNFLETSEIKELFSNCDVSFASVFQVENEMFGTSILGENANDIIVDRYFAATVRST